MRTSVTVLFLVTLAAGAAADTVVLKSGKTISNVVVSRNDGTMVVINPWNSRHAAMVWEIPEKNRIPADKVAEVIIEDPPAVEYLTRTARFGLTAEDHLELAQFCLEQKMKDERERHLALALQLAPQNGAALEQFGDTKYATFLRKNPDFKAETLQAAREYLTATEPADVAEKWEELRKTGTKRTIEYMERARRSAKIQKGRRDKVPLTVNSTDAPGATYAVYVSKTYDPLQPTSLVIGLHGGGAGGKDDTLVTGSGESAMNFYQQEAESWGWIVACPTALKAPWRDPANEPLLDALIEEMKLLYNIDERRIYLVGHSMGGFGTWHFGPTRSNIWAGCAPCAGGGGPAGIKIPVYIYHGSDDPICRVGRDRSAAKALQGSGRKAKPRDQFVYTELDGVGHGFPDSVRSAIFRWFAGIRKQKWKGMKYLDSSFERKTSRSEIAAFGDPSELPEAEGDDASVKSLVTAIKNGGGGGLEAARELGGIKTKEAANAVAVVLRMKEKASVDSRVLATQALGDIGLEECIKHLSLAVKAEDFRIVDAAISALGKIGTEDAVEQLAKAGKRAGEFFEGSFFGDTITHTEYEVRLESFGLLVDAFAKVGAKELAIPLFEREIVDPVFDPKQMYQVHGDEDSRFKNASPQARQTLTRRLAACLVTYGDPAGVKLLKRIKSRWATDRRIVGEVEQAIEQLGG